MSLSRTTWSIVYAAHVLSVLALSACGGTRPPSADPTIKITGLVVKGAVANANVTAYRVDASLARAASLGATTTDADGTFTLTVPASSGFIEIVATGGVYTDESVGTAVQLTSELTTLVAGTPSGAQTSVSATLSPVSTLARHLAKSQVRRLGASPDDAVSTAWTHVNAHFGALSWQDVRPTNVSPTDPVTVTLSDQTKAGLILAGISQLARSLAEASSLTPGTVVTGATLIASLTSDASDGGLDGATNATALVQGTQPLTAQTLRNELALAIVHFVNSTRNKTQLAGGDVFTLANSISSNSDPYLFGSPGRPLVFTTPAITFVDPPSFVSSTAVSLTVGATQSEVGVSAVRAQNVTNGATASGTFAAGAWVIPSLSLLEGANLIKVWAIDGTGSGSIADAVPIVVTRDTAAPSPTVRAHVLSYADERTLTLASANVPPVYVVAQSRSDVVAEGVFKAATRLAWSSQPSTAVLEGTNPENIPFLQLQVPVGAQEAPIAAATYAIFDGASTFTGDLQPWTSPASTAASIVYDLPLSSNIVPSLATTTTSPIVLTVSVTMTDAAGNSSGAVALPRVAFTVLGPPLFVTEDRSYASYGDTRSTYPYRIANNTYAEVFEPASTSFYGGQVRLLRYLVQNPTSQAVALASSVTGTWTMNETWTNFDAGAVRAAVSDYGYFAEDGFTFGDWWMVPGVPGPNNVWIRDAASNPPYPCDVSGAAPTAMHVLGDTAMKTTCVPGSFFGASPGTLVRIATSAPQTVTYQYQANPGEVASPAVVGGMYLVPAALGTVPGALTVYVARPVSVTRPIPLSWNATTSHYESVYSRFWAFESWFSRDCGMYGVKCWAQRWRAHQGGGWLSAASETLSSSAVTFTSRGVSGSDLLGAAFTTATFSGSRTLTSH